MKEITVLIPTYNRSKTLCTTHTSLCFQKEKSFDIVISDQSPEDQLSTDATFQTIVNVFETRGQKVQVFRNLPTRGMAQQRQFLLEHSHTRQSLFLDDDLILESYVIANMRKTIEKEDCGFVGCAVIGLSYKSDVRPHQEYRNFQSCPI